MFFHTVQKKRGFTLIEFQLYLFLLVTMLAILSGIGISVLESRSKAQTLEEINYNTQFIFEKVTTAVAGAEGVVSPPAGEASTTLTLQMSDPAKNPTVIVLSDTGVLMTEGAGESVQLSTDTIEVTELTFTNTTPQNTPALVRVSLGINGYGEEISRPTDVEYLFYSSFRIKY